MALPNWTIELLRRSLNEVAEKARQPETIEKIKNQASEILQDLPETAARGIDAVMRGAEASRKSVERWTRKHTQLAVPMLNATGVLMSGYGTGVPLADAVAEIGREVIQGDCVSGDLMTDRLYRRLNRAIGNDDHHAALVTSSFDAAVASLSIFSATHTIAVHRSNCVELMSGCGSHGLPLPSALSTIGVTLAGLKSTVMEVGSSNVHSVNDFVGIERPCIVIADGGDRAIEPFDLSAAQWAGADAIQVAILPVATLEAIDGVGGEVPSVSQWLSKVDMVVIPGNGLAGGPEGGILIGNPGLLTMISSSTAWPVLRASESTLSMTTVATEIASSSDRLPTTELIEASQENLKSRAERLATRLEACDWIQSCEITADDARLTQKGRWTLPSRQICLRHQSKSPESWAEELREELPSLLVAVGEDCVKLDLRWVRASDDSKLAEVLGSGEVLP
jgi:L-seryl-tRNA(Ser) seleniumtransferase